MSKQIQGCFTMCLPAGEATSSEPALAAVNLSCAAEILFAGFRAAGVGNIGIFNSSGAVVRWPGLLQQEPAAPWEAPSQVSSETPGCCVSSSQLSTGWIFKVCLWPCRAALMLIPAACLFFQSLGSSPCSLRSESCFSAPGRSGRDVLLHSLCLLKLAQSVILLTYSCSWDASR